MPCRISSTSSAPPAYTRACSPKRASSLEASVTVVGSSRRNALSMGHSVPGSDGGANVLAELLHDVVHLSLDCELAQARYFAQDLDLAGHIKAGLIRRDWPEANLQGNPLGGAQPLVATGRSEPDPLRRGDLLDLDLHLCLDTVGADVVGQLGPIA